MIIANASGKAVSNARPPKTSQVSLPSQTGSIDFIMTSPSAVLGENPCKMPIPRSNPSSTTYKNTPVAMMTLQIPTKLITGSVMADLSDGIMAEDPGLVSPADRPERGFPGWPPPRPAHCAQHAG